MLYKYLWVLFQFHHFYNFTNKQDFFYFFQLIYVFLEIPKVPYQKICLHAFLLYIHNSIVLSLCISIHEVSRLTLALHDKQLHYVY